ncbi:hydroxymethylglutaryl-CoA lyase [Zooshikella marina]|uniref:hydroxymethylglutaryl-CoA lyase n=1 Tax=Zooshikella ganghwensis TaxID=202772 RepID=UPI001BAEF0FD|nr:hydroxymethylglutaryl-CoA lyase [Zooshikella ganghwensis]MBU2705190.1 hydroxymethylglutaryl-CoA lyase [Zooshikella ganghwensis]
MSLPSHVRIVEVGPRDGLQNEPASLSVALKCQLIEQLVSTGIRHIETGSFVSPKWVPQMADTEQVMHQLQRSSGVIYSVLTPNLKGFERALSCQPSEIAVFAAASEEFSARNINCSITESLERFNPLIEKAKGQKLRVRGYISCTVGCPYTGDITPQQVAWVAQQLNEMGCDEISLGDTIGVGNPLACKRMLAAVAHYVPLSQLAVHFHDTYGQALANIYAMLEEGIATVDTAIAGLGGCPYAQGASGNVATEDVVYLLNGLGIQSKIDLSQLTVVSHWICQQLNRPNQSKVARALHPQRKKP